jgi:hypothetical protein
VYTTGTSTTLTHLQVKHNTAIQCTSYYQFPFNEIKPEENEPHFLNVLWNFFTSYKSVHKRRHRLHVDLKPTTMMTPPLK